MKKISPPGVLIEDYGILYKDYTRNTILTRGKKIPSKTIKRHIPIQPIYESTPLPHEGRLLDYHTAIFIQNIYLYNSNHGIIGCYIGILAPHRVWGRGRFGTVAL